MAGRSKECNFPIGRNRRSGDSSRHDCVRSQGAAPQRIRSTEAPELRIPYEESSTLGGLVIIFLFNARDGFLLDGFFLFRLCRKGRAAALFRVAKGSIAPAHAASAAAGVSSSSCSIPPSSALRFARIWRARSSKFVFALSKVEQDAARRTPVAAKRSKP